MSEHDDDWRDERHGFRMDGSLTELYATTANTLDRIRREFDEGGLEKQPIQAVLFVTLSGDGNISLFQAGGVQEIIFLATQAAEQAMRVSRESMEQMEDEDGEG